MEKAIKRICVCNEEEKKSAIIYTDTIKVEDHEFETLDGFYCMTCNSFWREP